MLEALFIGAGLFAAWKWFHRYPSGQGPFDHLPAGLKRSGASKPETVTASSGRSYRTYTWPPDSSGKALHLAESTGAQAWIAYWFTPATGTRGLYALRTPFATGSADDQRTSAQLKADFGVV